MTKIDRVIPDPEEEIETEEEAEVEEEDAEPVWQVPEGTGRTEPTKPPEGELSEEEIESNKEHGVG